MWVIASHQTPPSPEPPDGRMSGVPEHPRPYRMDLAKAMRAGGRGRRPGRTDERCRVKRAVRIPAWPGPIGEAVIETSSSACKRHRFPARPIAYAVWLYFRFPLSLRPI